MKKQKSIKLNFIMNSILTMSSFLFPLITFPYVSRILLAEGVGKVNFASSVISYCLMIAQLGVPTYGIRACARVRDDKIELSKTVHEIFIINIIMTIIAYIVFVIMLVTIPKLSVDKPLYVIVSLTMIFNAIGIEWLYKALEEYSYITVRSIVFKFIALIAMFLMVKSPDDYRIYAGITILAASASSVLNFLRVHKHIIFRWLGGYCLKRHMKSIIVFFSMACATTIYTNLDSVMLGFMMNDTDVGYYAAAIKIKNILASIVSSLGVVVLPRVSYYIKNDLEVEFRNITNKAINFVILIACPLIVYFSFYAKECISFLAGKEFSDSILPMQIIMPTLLFIGLTNIMGIQILVPLGKEKEVLHSVIVGAIVDLVFNLLFIPKFGISGAAIGTLLAETAVFIIQCISLKDKVAESFKSIEYRKFIVSCSLSIVISFPVKLLGLCTFFTLLCSSICFFGTYGLILYIERENLLIQIITPYLNKVKRAKGDKGKGA